MTGPVEESALTGVLRGHNPRLAVHAVKSLAELEAIDAGTLERARLIAFVTPVVVPARILKTLGFGAYNFHPGPPHYPGWVPSHFAIYDRATTFGATVHVMTERVDAGPIVAVTLFPVPANARTQDLEALAFGQLARLFWQIAKTLATQAEPIPELAVKWSGRKSTRRLYAAMCNIPPDVSKEELDRRVAVFGAGHFGLLPTLRIHGHEFRYVPPAAAPGNAVVRSSAAVPQVADS